ncbi:hypothetical protein [Nitrospira sp. Nam74]
MFMTLCRADQVFQDLLEEALAWTVSNLGHTSASRETYLKMLSHVSDYLDLSLALDLLRQLQRCHLAADCYELRSPHRVVLSDVVHRYCERYNQQPHTFGLHNKYGLLNLEWTPMLRLFIGEPYQDGAIMAPLDRESLTLRLVGDSNLQIVIPAEQSPFYRRGVPIYPAPRHTG